MAKLLLWFYVVGNFAFLYFDRKQGIETDQITFLSIWAAIGVIAVCDAIKLNRSSR